MSTLIANLCLILATLVFCIVFTPLFHTKISQSNDQGASGYVVIIVFLIHLVFLGLVALTYLAIARHGGLDWVSKNGVLRFMIVAVALLSVVSISAMSVASRFVDGSEMGIVHLLFRVAPIAVLIVVVGSGFILNNPAMHDTIPAPLYKWPMVMLAGCSFIAVLILLTTSFLTKSKGVEESTRNYENSPGIITQRLSELDQLDADADMVRILELSGGLYPTEVREKASVKFKTNPDWQKELIRLLENDQALEAFNFLQSNDVPDKNIFLEPIRTGINAVATRIRHDIQGTNPSEFYNDMFTDEVNRVLRTVEKFEGLGVDYLAAIKEMRLALDEPASKENVRYDCTAVLDSWIQKRQAQ